jgi:hypothetical protein
MKKSTRNWLIIIFLLTLTTRLILAFTIPNFTPESYFHLRQVEHITQTGVPLYNDLLSYGGREHIFLPAFHYLMAFFNLFLPLELVAKILPNLLLASLTIIIFFISKKIVKNEPASLFSALIVGFLPVLYNTNNFTVNSLFLPLIFIAIYAFLNIKNKTFLYVYILTLLALSLTSGATVLLLIGFAIYILLSFVENKRIKRAELELILFSLCFFLWVQFLFFKRVFLEEGISFIWQNIPPEIIFNYFPTVSILQAIVLVSVIPFLVGIYVVYRSLFQLKTGRSFLLISFVISTTILAWLRFIRFELSLSFFGITLAILFAIFFQDFTSYLYKTKLSGHKKYFVWGIAIILLVSMIMPAVNAAFKQDTPSNQDLAAFKWLESNTPQTATVLALLEEGHLVTYYGKKHNILDDQFSLIKDVEDRFNSLNILYTTQFQTEALAMLGKYDVQYIVFSPQVKEKFNINKLHYVNNCLEKVYNEDTRIYRVKCKLEETK